ncbi:Disks large 1 tumor suppressor protein [Fasciola hepatica]|uniref:Disks large 1 tumor suppressor protein n=1 Tax=Fasciola hepatica TaxID=6192 RepID=A0A4E0QYC5_FASHE|nr:Disks large 1 tumor suppressor protein [Fasciola hepatica]
MNSQEVAAPLVLSSPREKPLDHRTPLHTSRNGGSNHGEYVMPPANKQLESAVTHNQTGHVMDSNPLDHAPMGLVARASSVDHFATVPRLTTTLKKTMTVRALFDYDPLTDTGLPSRGLPFHHGDILHVVNASDREWWQARKVTLMPTAAISALSGHDSTSDSISSSVIGQSPLGIIPSCERIERRHRIRSKRVNFFTKVTVIGGGCLHGPPTGTPGMTSTTITSGNALNHSSALPLHPPLTARASASGPGLSSQTRTPVNGTNGEGQSVLPSNSATLERSNAVSDTVDGEKKMRSNSLTLNLFKRFSGRGRRKENSISLSGSVHSTPMDMAYEAELGVVRSYEVMTPISISLTRPLLVFGPLKERVIDVLLQDPKFTSCVPHTSRPPRAGEVNGVDYHFVGSKTQMEELIRADRFIEVGQFQDHYYATSVDSVCQVLLSGRVCVLNVNLTAIKRLEVSRAVLSYLVAKVN